MNAARSLVPGAVLLVVLAGSGCGRRAAPRPPEDVAPEAITDLRAARVEDGVQLDWSRPRRYVDGTNMPDLGGFFVQRATADRADGAFEGFDVVEVTDQQRFQKSRKFRFLDPEARADTEYRYRIVSFTVDGYHSAPSNVATANAAQASSTTTSGP